MSLTIAAELKEREICILKTVVDAQFQRLGLLQIRDNSEHLTVYWR